MTTSKTIRKALALDTKAERDARKAARVMSRVYKAWLVRGDAIQRELVQRESERARFESAMGFGLIAEHEDAHRADVEARRNARMRVNTPAKASEREPVTSYFPKRPRTDSETAHYNG